ncbi:hypothetical protein [Streptomyces sp. NPDC059063]|uniref:hypothetical protein n=1 Tax=unclassified Streptomyces TaxID=2593676 RepID=UPI0036C7D386
MSNRPQPSHPPRLPQRTDCAASWTTRATALCPALAVLLTVLVLCLGYVAHGADRPLAAAPAGSKAAASTGATVTASTGFTGTASTGSMGIAPTGSPATATTEPPATAPTGATPIAAPTAMGATHHEAAPPAARHSHPVSVHPVDCPPKDMCCDAGAHGVHAVRAASVQPQPGILTRTPGLPRPATPAHSAAHAPIRGSPDLHVLQVQRI